jgi:hypothetical protein
VNTLEPWRYPFREASYVAHPTPSTSDSRYWLGVGLLTEKAIHLITSAIAVSERLLSVQAKIRLS